MVGERMKAAAKEKQIKLAQTDTGEDGDKARAEIAKENKESADKEGKISTFIKNTYKASVVKVLKEEKTSRRNGKGELSANDENLLRIFYNNVDLFSNTSKISDFSSQINDINNSPIDLETLRANFFP
jgi:hypothetical protein